MEDNKATIYEKIKKSPSIGRVWVALIFGIYAAFVVLCNMPFVQHKFADWTAEALEKQLNTKVEVGSIDVGFLNNIIVNDLYVEDHSHKPMLKVARVSATINIFKLLTYGKIEIATAQLFGTKANIYKRSPDSDYNFQFVLDAFKSDKKESKPIDLRINSLIVRHANINYDILSEAKKNTLDTNHLKIENAGFNLSLRTFTPDSIHVTLKRFAAKESNSGLEIKELALRLEGNNQDAHLSDFMLSLPHSKCEIDTLAVHYPDFKNDHSFDFDKTKISASISPSDLSFLAPSLQKIDDTIDLSATLSGNNNELNIKKLSLSNNKHSIDLSLAAKATDYTTDHSMVRINVNDLTIAEGQIEKYVAKFTENSAKLQPLYNAGSIKYKGNINKNATGITSAGTLTTDAGTLTYSAKMSSDKLVDAKVQTKDIDMKQILGDDHLGHLNMNAEGTLDLSIKRDIPVGKVSATIDDIDYNGYRYTGISLEATNNATDITIKARSEDENVNFTLDGTLTDVAKASKKVVAALNVKNVNPRALNLSTPTFNDAYSFNLNVDGNYADSHHFNGNATLHDIRMITSNGTQSVNNIKLNAYLDGSHHQSIDITSDFLDATISGAFRVEQLASDFQNIIAHHLPTLVNKSATASPSDIKYNITFRDASILHHFIKQDYSVGKPITLSGTLNSSDYTMNLSCDAPKVTIGANELENIHINCSSSAARMMMTLEGGNQTGTSKTGGKIVAIAHGDKVDSDILLENDSKDTLNLDMFATTKFTKNNGQLTTSVSIDKSNIAINHDDWTINPATIIYCGKQIECHNFKLSNGNQYLEINGKASPNPNDSLVAKLKDIEVAYILDLVNFHSVRFGGKASGRAVVNNIFGHPDANASLFIHDFSLQDGVMGDANIYANWDNKTNGIAVNAHITDSYMSHVGLSEMQTKQYGVTDVNGYILPTKEELNLNVKANNTRTDFLKGFIGNIFKDIDGRITGNINVVGPFNDVNLIGDATVNMNFRLAATKVPYLVNGDTVHLRYHAFDFEGITLHDKQGNIGVLNGKMTHRNFANFTYDFHADLTNLCAYNETEFNADKYKAQVWANGDIHIYGSDGHPMYIDANVSPCKGSMFAYDSATPDALVNNTFIDFHDITPQEKMHTAATITPSSQQTGKGDSIDVGRESTEYLGDLYMNVNMDINPNCEIKLRMDNSKDGYISTFGTGTMQAKYYNKGSFQLFGNYNIGSGKYRLYLQDLVYRNLDIQNGSKVEFNGNPFDANIHLICKHEINSVPLSDLTATKAFSSNNKVKVDCFLDITGHLNNMDLSFSFELPNVSEETRQLVRSMINSDEEMNKQMIYLLGFQRFYPTDMATNSTANYGTQAVNSLLSSTISGQINQMLSNMIGTRSKWNFGTGITTGENGWQDLDVEGMLSGSFFNDRLLFNGNFGYRDNSLTNQANFIGDFELKYRIWDAYDFFVKAYNQTNDRYFTKGTLNTQGVGLSFTHDFEKYTLFNIFKKKNIQPVDSISK